MLKMWLGKSGPAIAAALLVGVSLTGCAGSLNSGGGGAFGANSEFANEGPFGQPKAGPPKGQINTAFQAAPAQAAFPAAAPAATPMGAPPAAASQPGIIRTAGGLPAADNASGYKIGPSDVIEITVFKVPELSKSVQVSDTGTVNLPLVGEVRAAGLTTQQFERELTAKLGAQYLQNPQVTVMVTQNNSQQVTIEGAVKKPGVYPLKGRTSLLQLVAISGGLEDHSDSTVLVLRDASGKRMAARFNMSDIQSGTATDPALQAGDVVVAGSSAIKKGFSTFLKALPIAGLFAMI